MTHAIKSLGKSQVELTITATQKDCDPYLEKAAVHLSQKNNIKGFRKGKAPYEIVKKELGEMAILQEALEDIVQTTFYASITKEGIDTVGMPKISIGKMAPGNDLVYTAVVAVLPKIKLPDIKQIKVKKETKPVNDADVDKTINAIREMNAKETVKTGPAKDTDKLVIDMDMFFDKVPVEGGQAKDYQVYLGEDHYIPGFNEQVVGMEKGQEKEFSLGFPKTHYQKHLAGKTVDFKIKVKDVYQRELPEINDELAKKLGQESAERLKQLMRDNLLKETEQKAEQKAEIEILDALIEKTEFEELPEILIDAEKQKIFYELRSDLDRHGIDMAKYLADIKKTQDELHQDFQAQAIKRAKAALISRQISKENEIVVSEEEIDKEIEAMRKMYQHNEEYIARLKRPEVRDTVAMTMQNRKMMDWLKTRVLSVE